LPGPAVFPGGNTFTHHIVQRLFEAQGLTPNIAMSTNYLETIKMMVSIGLAWSVLPRTMLDEQVARIALPGIQLSRQLGYIVHTERTLSNAARAFMALLDAKSICQGFRLTCATAIEPLPVQNAHQPRLANAEIC
jgi:DNA-binding transcriptional LysR family regulator